MQNNSGKWENVLRALIVLRRRSSFVVRLLFVVRSFVVRSLFVCFVGVGVVAAVIAVVTTP